MNILRDIFSSRKASENESTPREDQNYVDLTPVRDADPDGQYSAALTYALTNDRIKNFALTGPYGSGKSSIIRTFETNNSKYKFLNISLASFDERSEGKPSSTENRLIERSILQQMLYGADANRLPYSRFKRISTPDQPLAKSILLVVWILAVLLLNAGHESIVSLEPWTMAFYFCIFLISFAIALPVVIVSDVYKSTFGITFKKLSLKNAEFELGDPSEQSILNRHLDEIIYFFQATDYDVVVIEDLDRFGSPEIFVKLREINKLINDNEKTSGKIKFIYALRDDMFKNEDRAKFFDFIIPVVPIINNTNSLDKMQDRLRKLNLTPSIDHQFLREVSLYISDLRLLQNIFNEFHIYDAKLSSDKLDKTKLLAMMIYKNVYPSDFEKLHNSEGTFHSICTLKNKLVDQLHQDVTDNLSSVQKAIKETEKESLNEVQELIKLFCGHLVVTTSSMTNQPVIGIYINQQLIRFSELLDWETFEKLTSESNVNLAVPRQGYNNQYSAIATNKSFEELEEGVSPKATLSQRKVNIENGENSQQQKLQSKIRDLETEKSNIANLPLHKLLQKSETSLDKLFSDNKVTAPQLLNYLITDGYLDESYHLYISNFHEGRLTIQDRDFLLTIRSYRTPEPLQQIDTPKEVCANMRNTDFGQRYVLNVTLLDYLLENSEQHRGNLNDAMRFISNDFGESEEFFNTYWKYGKHIDTLVKELSNQWPDYAVTALKSYQAPMHLSSILSFVDQNYIANRMNIDRLFTEYLNDRGSLIYNSDLHASRDYLVLKMLNVKFHSLDWMKENRGLLDFVHSENLYAITPENIGLLLEIYSHAQSADYDEANYSIIQAVGSENLKKYIRKYLEIYIEEVLLYLPNNTKENEQSIKQLLKDGSIDTDRKEQIITKQDHIFQDFDELPVELWKYLLSEEKIIFSWRNISDYLENFEGEDERNSAETFITEILGRQHIIDVLIEEQINQTTLRDECSKSLSRFILNNNQIDDLNYEKLIKCLPYHYKDFPPDLSDVKYFSLAKHRTVHLNENSFNSAEHDNELLSVLIGKNIDAYQKSKESYPISDSVREYLLTMSEITDSDKLEIVHDVTVQGISESSKLADTLATLLILPNIDFNSYDAGLLESVIINTANVQNTIKMLSKCLTIFDKTSAIEILSKLPQPYRKIASFGKRPKIPLTDDNLYFTQQLEDNGLISSKVVEEKEIKINTFFKQF